MSENGNAAARRKGGRKLLGVVFEFAPLLLFFLVNGRYGPFGMLAESLAGTQITVNSVLPGPTNSRGVGQFVEALAKADGKSFEAFEKEYVRGLLSRHDGNVSKAARAAGIDRVYLHRLIRKYDLAPETEPDEDPVG